MDVVVCEQGNRLNNATARRDTHIIIIYCGNGLFVSELIALLDLRVSEDLVRLSDIKS